MKIKLLFDSLHLKPTNSLRVGLWNPLSLMRRKTLLSALPSVFHFRSHISPLGKNKMQGKTVKHLSYTIFSEPDTMLNKKIFITISSVALFFILSFISSKIYFCISIFFMKVLCAFPNLKIHIYYYMQRSYYSCRGLWVI